MSGTTPLATSPASSPIVFPTPALPPKVQAAVQVGPGPTALTAGFGSIWVAAHHGAAVERIDPSTNQVVDDIAVGTEPGALVAGLGHVWASDFGDGFGWRIDPATDKATRFKAVGGAACGWMAVGGGSVWISDCDAGHVNRIDPSTLRVTAHYPQAGDLTFSRGALWISSYQPNRLFRLDPGSGSETQFPDLGMAPETTAPDGIWALKATPSGQRIGLLDPATGKLGPTVAAEGVPQLAGSDVWLVDQDGVVRRLSTHSLTVRKWTELQTFGAADGSYAAFGALWVSNFDDGVVYRVRLDS